MRRQICRLFQLREVEKPLQCTHNGGWAVYSTPIELFKACEHARSHHNDYYTNRASKTQGRHLYTKQCWIKEICLHLLPEPPREPVVAMKLPPTMLVLLDNCANDNKSIYVSAYWLLLVAKGIFNEVFVSFLLVGHTTMILMQLLGGGAWSCDRRIFQQYHFWWSRT